MKNNEIQKSSNADKQSDDSSKSKKEQQPRNKGYWSAISIVILLLAVGFILYLYSANYHKKNYAILKNVNSELSLELSQRDSLINEWIHTFNEIESDLITMREKESILKFDGTNPEITKDVRERVLSEIQHLNSLLKENKAKIATLNFKLKKSGLEISALKEKVANLENEITERDKSIAELKIDLAKNEFILKDLNNTIDSLDYLVFKKDKEIESNIAKMNTAYIAVGSSKELKKKGLVEKNKGFLGFLGINKEVSKLISEKDFNKIDIAQTNKIEVNSKKAKLISDHPVSSYAFVKNNDHIAYLEIKDAKEFWKLTKYVVVETK